MIHLAIKNYILHIPYSIVLIIQMVIVVFIMNITFVIQDTQNKVLDNISFEDDFYLLRARKIDYEKVKEIEKIVGKGNVGYLGKRGGIEFDENDDVNSPAVYYISPLMEKVTYQLSAGRWFSGAANEIILGGEIGAKYKVGDIITLHMEEETKEVTVVGILRSPALVLDFSGMELEGGLYDMFFQQKNVCLTNTWELVEGHRGGIQGVDCMVRIINQEQLKKLQGKYLVKSLKSMYKESKEEARRYTHEQLLEISVLVGIAFLSVAIQIFLYLKKNKRELGTYRILGMSSLGNYGIVFFQYLCNMFLAFLILYILYDSTGVLAMEGLQWYQSMQWENWTITGMFFVVYMLVTGLVYTLTEYSIYRKEKIQTETCK